MTNKTKINLKNGFKSLINNDAVIESAKNNRWWIGPIIGLVACFVAVIPITISNAKTYGSSFLAKQTQNLEVSLTQACLDMKNNNIEFKVTEDNKLLYYKDGVEQNEVVDKERMLIQQYVSNRNVGGKIEKTVDLEIYYTTASTSKKAATTVAKIIKEHIEDESNYYKVGTTNKISSTDDEFELYYLPSYILLGKNAIYACLKKPYDTATYNYTAFTGNWKHTNPGELLSRVLEVNDIDAEDQNIYNEKYTKGVLDNWKKVFNESYLTQKQFNINMSLWIYAGIYALMVVFMGLMMFLLTRGKNNMFNYLKFPTTLQFACWSTITPALLALILGFVLPAYAMMYFIILLGIRVMWMSMKQLRPM